MGILDRLKPQPRWKHADAAIRLEAVRELDDQGELVVLAESDPDLKVRKAALALVTDVACLGRLAGADPDADIKERAADRLAALASQTGPDTEATALSAVAALGDPRRLSTLVKSGAPRPVRDAAAPIATVIDSPSAWRQLIFADL